MGYALREAIAAFRRTPVLTGLSAAMIALSLLVVGLFGVAAHNIRQALDRVESRVEIVAFLEDDAPQELVQQAEAEIRAFPEVREVIYVSRAQALELARQQLTNFRDVLTDLESNPMPAQLDIALHPGQTGADAVEAVARRIAAYPFIEEVQYGEDWLEPVYLLRRIAAAATLIIGGAFAAVAALIIGAAVRMAVFARREEIAIMRLVGATDGFVRRPFLLEGLLTGLIGALIALPFTWLVFGLLSRSVFQLDWIPDAWVLLGIAAGGLLGVLASWAAVRRHLQEI